MMSTAPLIDTHCHLTFDAFKGNVAAVLQRAADAGVARVITIATDLSDARAALELIETHANVCFAAGIHPHEAGKVSDDDLQALTDLHEGRWGASSASARPVAVGETGLDFHYDFAPPQRQEEVFRFQLRLACKVGRPVIIHARQAEQRVLEILSDYPDLVGRVVFHCYSGDADLASRIIDQGYWLSFTGVATFKNADTIREAARLAPSDRIMVETDAPYMSPVPVRNQRPCEPAFVAHTARCLADLRGCDYQDFVNMTTENAVRFFNLEQETA